MRHLTVVVGVLVAGGCTAGDQGHEWDAGRPYAQAGRDYERVARRYEQAVCECDPDAPDCVSEYRLRAPEPCPEVDPEVASACRLEAFRMFERDVGFYYGCAVERIEEATMQVRDSGCGEEALSDIQTALEDALHGCGEPPWKAREGYDHAVAQCLADRAPEVCPEPGPPPDAGY